MDVLEALKKRKSTRAFINKEVEQEKLEQLLNSAKYAPSGVNMQPWEVHVVTGKKKLDLENKIVQSFNNNEKDTMDYNYYPLLWEEPYKSRRKETGLLMYETLGITREDKHKQHKQWEQNYRAFEAPVVMYCFIDSTLEKGSYLDYGMFIQSILLGAMDLGLRTCPQASLAEFPQIIKEELKINKNKILLCGIALGYPNEDALINSYKTSRIELDEFVSFHK